jgi:hypothetical protein
MSAPQPKDSSTKILWSVVVVVVVLALALAVVTLFAPRASGNVTVLVRDEAGNRSVHTLALDTGALTERVDVSGETAVRDNDEVFILSDGSIIRLDPAGVIRLNQGPLGPVSVLIASPVAPTLRTPLTVWGEADRVAWMSPADGSVQVFARSERGAYLPVLLNHEIRPNSLGFSDDGNFLVAGVMRKVSTDFYALNLQNNKVSHVGTISGLVSVIPTP